MTMHKRERLPPLESTSEPPDEVTNREITNRESAAQPHVIPNPFDNIECLGIRAAQFVRTYLQTADLAAACIAARIDPATMTGGRYLADPEISRAIVTCAPFVGDARHASKLLRPYVVARLAGVAIGGRDAQAVNAIRDLLAVAGEGIHAKADDDMLGAIKRIMRERQAARERLGKPNGDKAEAARLPESLAVTTPEGEQDPT